MDTTAYRVRSTTPLGYVVFPMGPVPVQEIRTFHTSERSPCGGMLSRSGGSVERGDQPVSGGFHERAPVSGKLPIGQLIVCIEDVPPTLIAELGGPLGRANDVGEQDRRQQAVGVNGCWRPGKELLDLVDD
jgi:hypothetical protein